MNLEFLIVALLFAGFILILFEIERRKKCGYNMPFGMVKVKEPSHLLT